MSERNNMTPKIEDKELREILHALVYRSRTGLANYHKAQEAIRQHYIRKDEVRIDEKKLISIIDKSYSLSERVFMAHAIATYIQEVA